MDKMLYKIFAHSFRFDLCTKKCMTLNLMLGHLEAFLHNKQQSLLQFSQYKVKDATKVEWLGGWGDIRSQEKPLIGRRKEAKKGLSLHPRNLKRGQLYQNRLSKRRKSIKVLNSSQTK
jgi:hypothetical protein